MNSWASSEVTLIIGHRGASIDFPENTLAAFALVAEQGADGIEVDVRFSAGNPHHSLVDERYMTWTQKRGYRVYTWTVDDPQEASRLAALGVHDIITNNPRVIHQHLN